jgi:hypothetical protein
MKTQIIIIGLACGCFLFAGCGGDHSASSGKDTLTNTYDVKKDSAKPDTNPVTSPDHTASGGTDLSKDTAKNAK